MTHFLRFNGFFHSLVLVKVHSKFPFYSLFFFLAINHQLHAALVILAKSTFRHAIETEESHTIFSHNQKLLSISGKQYLSLIEISMQFAYKWINSLQGFEYIRLAFTFLLQIQKPDLFCRNSNFLSFFSISCRDLYNGFYPVIFTIFNYLLLDLFLLNLRAIGFCSD